MRAAIAAKADGIVTTSPDPGSMNEVVNEAHAAGIPIININTPDPTADFDAYVGMDLVITGKQWAQYLVDKGLVKSGDFVWMPVEVPGATYGVQEEEGIKSVFEPLGITWEVTDNTLDQAEVITRMSDYLTANRAKVKAIIGLGDLVTGSIKRVFDQVGVKPGEIPVVGWGNSLDTTQEVLEGYVNAAMWQDPHATSYVGALARQHGRERHSRRASTCWSATSTKRTAPRTSTTSCPASKPSELLKPPVAAPKPPRVHPEPERTAAADMAIAHDTSGHAEGATMRQPLIRRLIAKPEFGPFVLLVIELIVFTAINPDFLSPLNISQHAGLHGRARPHRAGHDAPDDRRRIRPFGRRGLRLLADRDVDPVQQRHHAARGRLPRRDRHGRR